MTDISQAVLETIAKSFSSKKPADEDVEDFENRVFSYIEGQKWATRPLILSPSVCAQYGWKCVNSNLLECVTCNAKLCAQEPKIEIYDAYKACIEKILSDLKDSHKTHCPWPLTPSPESFVKMVPLPKEEALSQFVLRLKHSLQFECLIPQIKASVPSLLGLNQQHVLSLCKLAEISSEDVHLIGMSVVCMAATGWSLLSKKNGDVKTYVKCESCQRSIWIQSLNLINTLDTDEASTNENGTSVELTTDNDIVNGSPRKKIKLEKIDFDSLEEHRPWCLWVSTRNNKLNQKDNSEEETSFPGWKIFVKSLLRNVSNPQDINSENSPSKEELRNVRNLLESWTSPTK